MVLSARSRRSSSLTLRRMSAICFLVMLFTFAHANAPATGELKKRSHFVEGKAQLARLFFGIVSVSDPWRVWENADTFVEEYLDVDVGFLGQPTDFSNWFGSMVAVCYSANLAIVA